MLSEYGSLKVAALARKLPCSDSCTLKKDCADRYQDGTCKEKIDTSVATEVYGTPGEKTFVNNEIQFQTTKPEGAVSIKEGFITISRPQVRPNYLDTIRSLILKKTSAKK